ncbi:MAG: NAD(+)/NADH kinase, partial [Balneolaceae bacterium]
MKFAVIANPKKYSVKEPFIEILKWSDDHEVKVIFCEELKELYQGEEHPSAVVVEDEEKAIDLADIIIALGGDGTMLYTARLMKNIQ